MLSVFGLQAFIKKPQKRIILAIALVGLVLGGLWMYVQKNTLIVDPKLSENLLVSKRNLLLPSILWAASTGLLVAFLLVKRARNIFLLLVIGVVTFDLFRFGWKFTPFVTRAYFFPTTQAVSFLQSQPKPFRIMSLDNRIMPPNVNAYYGIESIEGYDPVYDSRYEEFIAALNRNEPNIKPPFGFNRIITGSTIHSALLPFLNVKYILTLEELKDPQVELMYQEGSTRVYWYKKALPRVYVPEGVVRFDSKQEFFDLVYTDTFDPLKTALVEEFIELVKTPLMSGETAQIDSYSSSEIQIKTKLINDRLVVVANMYAPGWKATIDGRPTSLYRTNYIFQGVVVPEGEHILKIQYH
jgi:hypothetical protein